MTLYINTSSRDEIVIALLNGEETLSIKKIKAEKKQSEKLLPAIDKLLKLKKVKLCDLDKIVVANYGSSFTSLRIGVVTANALGYALNIPVESEDGLGKVKKFLGHFIVEPCYSAEPNIGISKKKV